MLTYTVVWGLNEQMKIIESSDIYRFTYSAEKQDEQQ
jgi:hypothetical protein